MSSSQEKTKDFLDRFVTFVAGTYRNDKCIKLLGWVCDRLVRFRFVLDPPRGGSMHPLSGGNGAQTKCNVRHCAFGYLTSTISASSAEGVCAYKC